jgi:hypothetical protein
MLDSIKDFSAETPAELEDYANHHAAGANPDWNTPAEKALPAVPADKSVHFSEGLSTKSRQLTPIGQRNALRRLTKNNPQNPAPPRQLIKQ